MQSKVRRLTVPLLTWENPPSTPFRFSSPSRFSKDRRHPVGGSMNNEVHEITFGRRKPKVAVLFHGLLRTTEETAAYWREYVLNELEADAFVWTADTWFPAPEGNIDRLKDRGVVANANVERHRNDVVSLDTLQSLFGPFLKSASIYRQNFTEFLDVLKKVL